MFKKSKYIVVLFISLSIVSYGFITVSNVLPDFIKDRSYFKVIYTSKPFDLQFDIGDYVVYLNSKAVDNYKKGTNEVIKKIVSNNPLKKLLKQ
jgi:hypothetical protein